MGGGVEAGLRGVFGGERGGRVEGVVQWVGRECLLGGQERGVGGGGAGFERGEEDGEAGFLGVRRLGCGEENLGVGIELAFQLR